MAAPTTQDGLKDFIANALTEDITCYGGDDEDQVKKVGITTSQTQAIMLNLIIGICVTLTVLVFSDKIKDMIKDKYKYGGSSLPTGVAYISIIFIIMCVMDLIFGGVNANNYFMIWGFVMLMIPLSLIAKYSFGDEFKDSINFEKFGEMIRLHETYKELPLSHWSIIMFLICFPIAIGVGTASSLDYSVQFPVFLTFSLLFFVSTIIPFFYNG